LGPDGHLYASLGDDGTGCGAQDLSVLAGKILRFDIRGIPDGAGGPAPYALITAPGNPYAASPDSAARLVWVLGLRNPFRFHIDPATGDLFVADVGQNTWEEFTRFGAGGGNGGWPWREGPSSYASCGGPAPSTIAPIAYYDHGDGAAIVSGGVYRRPASGGARFPAEYDGNAFYIDYYTGFMRRLAGSGANWSPALPVEGQPNPDDWATGLRNVSDLLPLPDGSLVYVRQSVNFAAMTGEIRRIAFAPTTDALPFSPGALRFAPPRPSPSTGPVTLSWSQPAGASVELRVLDASGRLVRTIESGAWLPAGPHERVWNGTNHHGLAVPPGLYFVRLEAGGRSRTVRITLLR
jgi:hypothetical protein